MSSILVTGASGFIGRALTKRLRGDDYQVVAMGSSDGDISSPSTWQNRKIKDVSHVFHLAGKTYVPDSWDNPYGFYKTNMLGTESALEFCRKKDVPITYISAYIYGVPKRLPISEDAPVQANNPYAHSKYLSEELCRFYASNFGQAVSVIRPFNVFGVGQNTRFLIPMIIQQALYHDEIVVNDLSPRRDYVHVSDLVDALAATLSLKNSFNLFNIGSGVSFSVGEIIDIIQKCADTNKPVKSKGDVRPNEIPDVKADTSHARDILDWKCHINFESGIAEMIRWERSK